MIRAEKGCWLDLVSRSDAGVFSPLGTHKTLKRHDPLPAISTRGFADR
jgi:hypothetical protein